MDDLDGDGFDSLGVIFAAVAVGSGYDVGGGVLNVD